MPKAPIVAPYQQWDDPDGQPYVWFFTHEFGYHILFRRLAEFVLSSAGECVSCYPFLGVAQDTVRHLFIDLVMPLVLSCRGRLSLHASAVATEQGVIAFVGKSGLGKSTLAANLGRKNLPILCDDFVVLRQQGSSTIVIPSYPGVRLWPDSLSVLFKSQPSTSPVAHYHEKRRLTSIGSDLTATSYQLRRIYVLSTESDFWDGGEIGIAALSAREAVIELSKYAHLLDSRDQASIQRRFHMLADLVSSIPCYRLFFPYDFSQLDIVSDMLIQHDSTDRC